MGELDSHSWITHEFFSPRLKVFKLRSFVAQHAWEGEGGKNQMPAVWDRADLVQAWSLFCPASTKTSNDFKRAAKHKDGALTTSFS